MTTIEDYFPAFLITLVVAVDASIIVFYYIRDLKRQLTDARIREIIHRREEAIRYRLLLDQIKQQDGKVRLMDDLHPFFGDKIDDIRQRFPQLTDLDCKVLILIGLGVENYEIIRLTDMSKRTYYKRRQLIAQRLGTTAAQLDAQAKQLFTINNN